MKRWIIEDMINRLDNWEGSTIYIGSLSTYIYQSVIANGSVLCNTYATREWIGKYLNDIADVIDDYDLYDVFDFSTIVTNPEDFHVNLVCFLAREYIMESDWVSEHEEEDVKLTKEIIDIIKKELLEAI